MNQEEINGRLVAIFNGLNSIEVKGFSNVNNLAGCLQILKEILDAQQQVNSEDE